MINGAFKLNAPAGDWIGFQSAHIFPLEKGSI